MITDQFQRERVFRLGTRIGMVMHDILTPAMTVRKDFAQQPDDLTRTLFYEVQVVPFEQLVTFRERELYDLKRYVENDTREQFFARITDALCDHIVANWRPEAVHLLFHSSGWDSRVLSLILRKLAQERGSDWLGRLVVFSFGAESTDAKRIIDAVGWPETSVVLLPDPADWLWPLFDIETAGKYFNGAHVTVPVTRYWLAQRLVQLGILPADPHEVQAVSGFGSDYAMRGAHKGLLCERMAESYKAATSIGMRSVPDEILPWFGYGVARAVVESSHHDMYKLRQALVRYLGGDAIADMPRWAAPWPVLPVDLMAHIKAQYRASWYGQAAAPDAEDKATARPNWSHGGNGVERAEWWSHWTAACYCERLLREDYTLSAMGETDWLSWRAHEIAARKRKKGNGQ